ncbi:hypothetical protein H4V97_001372 [Flavobacterium sp. CG_23.5]|uniref:WbqC family protein n=1 Tax=Flavobacterium sp. CG_23.5 TaxID=2760708 RepID=UPI001AE6B9D5|nr:WbqC family protein [Flavobacterium sp. CG_23.5]MBP2283054.1 hypothetical protein [Flavobacterium sp. CG_23.5]
MKVAIMQPYFLPYIGYFQLINMVDVFVIYDNIEYTKKGWINRNRILVNGKDEIISLPIKKSSDYLHINQRVLSETWEKDKLKLLNKVKANYRKAPYFDEVIPLMEECMEFDAINLFDFIYHSLTKLCKRFDINTEVVVSSELDINHNLKSSEKVMEICKFLTAEQYINTIGGLGLYSKEDFSKNGIVLNFIKTNSFIYKQFDSEFITFLSIIDVMMFNSNDTIKKFINNEFILI